VAGFGVTNEGFNLKGFDVILSECRDRARQMFGPTIDLTATSPLRKLLEVTSAEDAELWKRMEDLYYSNFVSTAQGDTLDLLGQDVGLTRQPLFSEGEVKFTLSGAAPGRRYVIAEGTAVVTDDMPPQAFYTIAPITLNSDTTTLTVGVRAFEPGKDGDILKGKIKDIDPAYRAIYFSNLGGATLAVTNDAAFSGGLKKEDDDAYRARLLGLPRNIWTLESIRHAVTQIPAVIDVRVYDPLGGVDVSQSYFNLFSFAQRVFSSERRFGEPYFFDVVVAHEFAWPWHTQGVVTGIFEQVSTAIEKVRPIGIFPNITQADHVEVGMRARVTIDRGYDPQVILSSIKQRILLDIGALKLGSDVLYSQVMRAFVEQLGVVDVQNLHLRRCPASFGRVTFGKIPFQLAVVEAEAGENLTMGETEIAFFRIDSNLIDVEVVKR